MINIYEYENIYKNDFYMFKNKNIFKIITQS